MTVSFFRHALLNPKRLFGELKDFKIDNYLIFSGVAVVNSFYAFTYNGLLEIDTWFSLAVKTIGFGFTIGWVFYYLLALGTALVFNLFFKVDQVYRRFIKLLSVALVPMLLNVIVFVLGLLFFGKEHLLLSNQSAGSAMFYFTIFQKLIYTISVFYALGLFIFGVVLLSREKV